MSTLRITLTDEIQQILTLLQINYPTLSTVEITKLALGELQKNTVKRQSSSLIQFMSTLPKNSHLSDDEVMELSVQAIKEVREGS